MGEIYSHPDHGEMEWVEKSGHRVTVEGWRCSKCHVIAESDDADTVFDNHDCEQYQKISKGITESI